MNDYFLITCIFNFLLCLQLTSLFMTIIYKLLCNRNTENSEKDSAWKTKKIAVSIKEIKNRQV